MVVFDGGRRLNLKEKLNQGEVLWGPFLKFRDPAIVEILGRVGFHFVIIDEEHGTLNAETTEELIRAASLSGIAPIVRVADNRPVFISRALDMGASGILVPHVSQAADAAKVVSAAKFWPLGQRGVDPTVRAGGYSTIEATKYYKDSNIETVIILQIEGLEGVQNAEEIASVSGVDVIFVGPYDLSQSMGILGEVKDAKLLNTIKEVISICEKRNIVSGVFAGSVEDFEYWIDAGVQLVAYLPDCVMFASACSKAAQALAAKYRERHRSSSLEWN